MKFLNLEGLSHLVDSIKDFVNTKMDSISLKTGTNNGTLKLTVNGKTTDNIAVKGLGSAAYTASSSYATSGHTHNYAGSSSTGGSANSAVKLNTARKIGLSGGVTGTATSFDGSSDITIPVTSVSPSHISDGYTTKGFYINTHPENSPTIIPFINNDIAYLLKRGGSAKIYYDGVEQSVDISSVFDGSPSYWAINPTNITKVVIELTLHKVFAWTNTVYVDCGANGWRAKNVKLEVINTNYTDDVWMVKSDNTDRTISQFKHTFSHKPVGAENEGGGFNKIRLTFSNWNSANIFRIAAIGIVNFGSMGLRETFLPRDGGETFGSINPFKTDVYDLGNSVKKWNNMYANTFNGALNGNANTATKLKTARTVQTNLGSTSTASFDGSANITPGVTGTLPIANGGTGSTTAAGALTNLGITATASELNKLDGVTATTTELNYVDGVTSNIQTQLNGKANTSHGNHVPTTQTANNATFLRNDNTWQKVTPANIGAATSNHTHNYAGSSSAGGDAINSDKLDGYHADDFMLIYGNYGANYFNSMDLDTWTRAGNYAIQSGCTNAPAERGEDVWGTIFVVKGLSDRISQFAVFWNESGNPLWHRCKNSSTWSTWKKVRDGGNANSATHANYLSGWSDTRHENTAPNDYNGKLYVKGLKLNNAINSPDSSEFSSVLGFRSWSDASGGHAHELAFTGNGQMFQRHGDTDTWSSWNRFYTSENITYGTNELTPGSSSLASGHFYYQYE